MTVFVTYGTNSSFRRVNDIREAAVGEVKSQPPQYHFSKIISNLQLLIVKNQDRDNTITILLHRTCVELILATRKINNVSCDLLHLYPADFRSYNLLH